MQNLSELREWLIQKGVPPEHLDSFEEAPVIRDIGQGLLLSLQNDDDIGGTLVMLLDMVFALQVRVETLEGGSV